MEISEAKKVAKGFMIFATVIQGVYLIPLLWCIPMTISYSNKIKCGKPVSTGFKVCVLLFVSSIAGIIMLCDRDKISNIADESIDNKN